VAFSGVLWSISRLLFAVAVGYAALGSLLAILLRPALVRLNYDQSDREASFRAELVHVRQNAESVALLGREPASPPGSPRRSTRSPRTCAGIIAVNRNLGFFTTGYNYMIQLIPVLIVAPLFIRGTAEFGEIPQASMAFAHLAGAFSLVVNQFGQLSSYAAVLARLQALGEAADTAPPSGSSGIAVAEDGGRLAFERLTLRTPQDGRVLVRGFSLEVAPGGRALVVATGDTTWRSSARSRACGRAGEGRIVRPGDVMFLPERSYLPPGTLRDLLVRTGGTDDEIWAALRTAGVEAVRASCRRPRRRAELGRRAVGGGAAARGDRAHAPHGAELRRADTLRCERPCRGRGREPRRAVRARHRPAGAREPASGRGGVRRRRPDRRRRLLDADRQQGRDR
jgi:putative ATP-binding cassette transporter